MVAGDLAALLQHHGSLVHLLDFPWSFETCFAVKFWEQLQQTWMAAVRMGKFRFSSSCSHGSHFLSAIGRSFKISNSISYCYDIALINYWFKKKKTWRSHEGVLLLGDLGQGNCMKTYHVEVLLLLCCISNCGKNRRTWKHLFLCVFC